MYSHKGESPDSEVALKSVFFNFRLLDFRKIVIFVCLFFIEILLLLIFVHLFLFCFVFAKAMEFGKER